MRRLPTSLSVLRRKTCSDSCVAVSVVHEGFGKLILKLDKLLRKFDVGNVDLHPCGGFVMIFIQFLM